MKFISNESFEYIMSKYHSEENSLTAFIARGGEPYDYNRFVRRDELFAADSGLAADEVVKEATSRDEKSEHLSHPVRKANALKYILENTRISCDPRDVYPAINMIDRPLRKVVSDKWRKEVCEEIIPEVEKKRLYLEKEGIATSWLDYDHSVPNWDRIVEFGFSGLLAESEKVRSATELKEAENEFFEGIRISYEAIISFVKRLRDRAVKDGNERMANALATLA